MFVMQSAEFANILDGVIQKWTVLIQKYSSMVGALPSNLIPSTETNKKE